MEALLSNYGGSNRAGGRLSWGTLVSTTAAVVAAAQAVLVAADSIRTNSISGSNSKTAALPLTKIQLKQKITGERAFVDGYGRERLFHGVNAVVKGAPWIPSVDAFDADISLSDKDLSEMASIGMNVVRLGVMWPGVEPKKGEFDKQYMAQAQRIVQTAARHGVYVIVDLHQDVLSEDFCGEGAPSWLMDEAKLENTFPSPKNDKVPYTDFAADGFPTRSDCSKSSWASYYSTYECSAAFEALYTSPQLLGDWTRFWQFVASYFSSEAPAPLAAARQQLQQQQAGLLGSGLNVLGYELINEPWAGDVFSHPTLLVPGVADKMRLQAAYDALAPAIREVDKETLIMFAGVTWDDFFPAGFEHAPGDTGEDSAAAMAAAMAERSVFAYHYYNPPQVDGQQDKYFAIRRKDARRLQVGSMLTEFERPRNDANMSSAADPFFATARSADKYLESWCMWELKTFCKESEASLASDSQAAEYGSCKTGYGESDYLWTSDGKMNDVVARKLSRTYASAVAGTALSMQFDQETGAFELRFLLDPRTVAPTEVFAHSALQYPDGMQVEVSPPGVLTYETDTERNLLLFSLNRDQGSAGAALILAAAEDGVLGAEAVPSPTLVTIAITRTAA